MVSSDGHSGVKGLSEQHLAWERYLNQSLSCNGRLKMFAGNFDSFLKLQPEMIVVPLFDHHACERRYFLSTDWA
jgi:hypothetical protein